MWPDASRLEDVQRIVGRAYESVEWFSLELEPSDPLTPVSPREAPEHRSEQRLREPLGMNRISTRGVLESGARDGANGMPGPRHPVVPPTAFRSLRQRPAREL